MANLRTDVNSMHGAQSAFCKCHSRVRGGGGGEFIDPTREAVQNASRPEMRSRDSRFCSGALRIMKARAKPKGLAKDGQRKAFARIDRTETGTER
jgi:hypothetical protein